LQQSVDKAAVADAVKSAGSVDSGDPEAAEFAFFLSAIAVGVFPCLHQRLVGGDEEARLGAAEAFRVLEDLFVALLKYGSTFYTRHFRPPSSSCLGDTRHFVDQFARGEEFLIHC